jgi:eukaryotic-like serine/threonine-protein kinase
LKSTERASSPPASAPGPEKTDRDSAAGRTTAAEMSEVPANEPTGPTAGAGVAGNAITKLDRDATAARDHESTTVPDRDVTGHQQPDATVGALYSPDVAGANWKRASQSTHGRGGSELPRIAGYEILGVLGAGGMGIVYQARHLRLDRIVALKMIRAGAGALPSDLARFEAEARAVAAIDHLNIIKIFEIGEHDGLPYFSLEFLEGGSLSKQIAGKPQSVDVAARMIETLARAMDVAHRRGIVHRDIKPSNVLLAANGTPKIADFGLVKRLETDSAQTDTGSVLGSPSYMAPEQTTGAEKAGPAADQYALGATLYEMLTGRPPFRATSVIETLDLVRNTEPVAPAQLLPKIPRDLETICLKALQKDPARRYPDVAAMAEDLRRFHAGEPIVARPVSRPERVWRWCRRNPGVALLLGAVAASLVFGIVGTSYYAIQAGKREQEALANARIAREEKARSDLRWYAAQTTLAQKDWEEGELASLRQRLGILEQHALGAPDPRGFEWYHLQRLCRLDMHTFPGHSAPVRCVAFTRDGNLLASASGNYGSSGEVKVWDLATGRELHCLRGHKDLVSCVAFSPDGRRLVSANGGVRTPGEIKIWDVAAGREVRALPAHATPVRGLAFSPDGRQLASVGSGFASGGTSLPGELKIWDAASGKQLRCIPGSEPAASPPAFSAVAFSPDASESKRRVAFADGHTVRTFDPATGKEPMRLSKQPYPVNSVAYSPDGRWLASGSADGAVIVRDTETGREAQVLRHPDGISGLAFSPDGRRLAGAAGNSIVKVWDVTTGNEALVLHGHTDTVATVAFSPDGWRLASAGGDGTVKLWDATTAPQAVSLPGRFSHVNDFAFDADGRRMAIASGFIVRVLDTTTRVEVRTLTAHAAHVRSVAYSPDSRRLASAGDDRTVRVWDATNGAEIFCLRGHTAPVFAVAFSPDGQRLASISRGPAKGGRRAPGEVSIWDLRAGQSLLTLPGQTEFGSDLAFAHMAFSPDGTRLATNEGRTVRVWNATTGQQILALGGLEGIVTRVAYSPDGSRLAAASRDGSVKIWDAVTGEAVFVLRGHTSAVHGLAYSPDGRRLATVVGGVNKGGERLYTQVKLWDPLTGQEILTLRGTLADIPRVAFDPGGRRLAASGETDVTIWEGIPLDTELAEERQAASLVGFLFGQSLSPEVVSARLKDYAISDAVRERAVNLVEPIWQSRVRQDAERVVHSLFAKPLFRSEVLERLRADRVLSESVRREALALGERYVQFPSVLDHASREGAGRPGADPSAYRLALKQAELVCQLMPSEGSYHTTLGMAHYRLGHYQEALAELTRTLDLNQATHGGPVPADLAFLAMTRFRIGESDRARASLTELRETMQKPNWARNEEAQRLLKEAESLLAGRTAPPDGEK